MPMINLLPWREDLRQKRKKEFLVAALGAVIAGVILTMGTRMYYGSLITAQEERNNMLRAEITALDRQIEEINELDAQKQRLLARMRVIDELQQSRPEAVHLMDEAVNILPDGTYLTALDQDGRRIEIEGVAQSSSRVSQLMRNVNDSNWLRDVGLERIRYSGDGPNSAGEFTLFANQIQMRESGGEL